MYDFIHFSHLSTFFVQFVESYNFRRYSLPRVAAAQCEASTKKDISQLEPGDLVFYGSGYIDNVALYIGDGKIIHASNAATGIKISDYDYEKPAAVGTFME